MRFQMRCWNNNCKKKCCGIQHISAASPQICFPQHLKAHGSMSSPEKCLQKTQMFANVHLQAAACRSSECDRRTILSHIITTLSTIRHLRVQDNHRQVHQVTISTV